MKNYKKLRLAYFWLAIIAYFVPYIAVTAALLPFMTESQGMKWGIGLAVVALNALPFLGGMLRSITAHFPFINFLALFFVILAGFFTLDVFQDYVHTFMTIEAVAAFGSFLACVFWGLHKKYKRKDTTMKDIRESGILER